MGGLRKPNSRAIAAIGLVVRLGGSSIDAGSGACGRDLSRVMPTTVLAGRLASVVADGNDGLLCLIRTAFKTVLAGWMTERLVAGPGTSTIEGRRPSIRATLIGVCSAKNGAGVAGGVLAGRLAAGPGTSTIEGRRPSIRTTLIAVHAGKDGADVAWRRRA